jgi:predicted transcriptional regulator YheO
MTQNRRKPGRRSRSGKKETGHSHTPLFSPPSVDPKIKGQYLQAQIRKIERQLTPLGIKVNINSLDDLKAFMNKLMQLQADKKIESHETRALNDSCEILRKIYQPSEVEENVDELLKQTQTLREEVAQLRQSGLVA